MCLLACVHTCSHINTLSPSFSDTHTLSPPPSPSPQKVVVVWKARAGTCWSSVPALWSGWCCVLKSCRQTHSAHLFSDVPTLHAKPVDMAICRYTLTAHTKKHLYLSGFYERIYHNFWQHLIACEWHTQKSTLIYPELTENLPWFLTASYCMWLTHKKLFLNFQGDRHTASWSVRVLTWKLPWFLTVSTTYYLFNSLVFNREHRWFLTALYDILSVDISAPWQGSYHDFWLHFMTHYLLIYQHLDRGLTMISDCTLWSTICWYISTLTGVLPWFLTALHDILSVDISAPWQGSYHEFWLCLIEHFLICLGIIGNGELSIISDSVL